MSSTETKKKGSKQNSREFAPLTDKKLQAVKPRQKRYTLRDGRGLFLDVTPGGVRTWVFRYTRPQIRLYPRSRIAHSFKAYLLRYV
jgi:hypothetical protein